MIKNIFFTFVFVYLRHIVFSSDFLRTYKTYFISKFITIKIFCSKVYILCKCMEKHMKNLKYHPAKWNRNDWMKCNLDITTVIFILIWSIKWTDSPEMFKYCLCFLQIFIIQNFHRHLSHMFTYKKMVKINRIFWLID